jgi:uncharacterized protein (TIGR04551 family)
MADLRRFAQWAMVGALAAPIAARAEGEEEDTPTSLPTTATGTDARKPSLLSEIDDRLAPGKPAWDAPSAPPPPSFPYVEYHGYFRLRPDLISNGHLGIAAASSKVTNGVVTTSAILPPLSRWPQNNDAGQNPDAAHVGNSRDDSTLAGANMRFRIEPTLHLSENIRIRSTLDILDNQVLGGNPDYAGTLQRADVPLSAFALSSRPGTIAVKEAYAEWRTLLGTLRFGRQASQWGLGVLASGGAGNGWDGGRPEEYYGGARMPWEGSGYDSDFAVYVDRAAFVTRAFGTYLSVFYDYAAKGLLGVDPNRFDGQIHDMGSADDVSQVGFAVLQRPLTADDAVARKSLLLDEQKGALDWGLYTLYRTQDLDVQGSKATQDLTLDNATKTQWMQRGASALIADLWLRYERRFAFSRRLVIEAEGVFINGRIDNANGVFDATQLKPRDIQMWGGALKSAWQNEGIGIYFDAGVASGDDTRCFGVYGDAACAITTADGRDNKTISAFKFNRDFRVDSLLFRDVIGAVTNAVYAKPTFSINAYPFYAPQMLGADLGVLYAMAMDAGGTPGNASVLGTELMARGYFGQRGLFRAQVSFSYLLPGDAFQLRKDYYAPQITSDSGVIDPSNAWRVLGHVVLMF